jgi:glycosyltransferase involved in cell wall biosynthesis
LEVANSLRDADLSLFSNHRDLEYGVEKLGVDPGGTGVFAKGIPEAFLNLDFEPTPEAEDSVIRIALVATYIPRKGIHHGVPALNKILARYPRVDVNFMGTGCPEAQVYADFEPFVGDRIRFVPRYSHAALPDLLRGHHIKLFPTLSDGFGLALIEAMACGLAPVTTTTPGPMEVVRDGDNGIVVPPRDTLAIDQALERLITDPPYLQKLRRNAYATAQKYSWHRIARDNLTLYEAALSYKRGTK